MTVPPSSSDKGDERKRGTAGSGRTHTAHYADVHLIVRHGDENHLTGPGPNRVPPDPVRTPNSSVADGRSAACCSDEHHAQPLATGRGNRRRDDSGQGGTGGVASHPRAPPTSHSPTPQDRPRHPGRLRGSFARRAEVAVHDDLHADRRPRRRKVQGCQEEGPRVGGGRPGRRGYRADLASLVAGLPGHLVRG